ncbi:MAG TPA: nitronate monooxygenase family protein [Mycobacteriales bacterium]|nr:nitronate monooxygenase family protein [Mycobacteriales bacterium]
MRTPLSEEFGLDLALFAFNYQPDVVIEVCKAGGMGVLGAVRFTPQELKEALDHIEANIGGRPYGVDVVMPAKTEAKAGMDVTEMHEMLEKMIPQEHKEFVESVLDKYGVPKLPEGAETGRDLLSWNDTEARQQVSLALERPDVKLIVNALGAPPKDVVDQAHDAGVKVAALVGRRDHALKQVANDVDIIVAQGTEAGGHSGDVATMVLVPEVVEAVSPRPVLAAGGIGSGRQVAAALSLGAQGVWTGSIWLSTVECGQPEVMQEKFRAATSSDAVRSRAYTGKPARQLRTAWTEAWDDPSTPAPLGMPLQYMLCAEAQDRIRRSGNAELMGTPIGQLVGSFKEVRTVAEVVAQLKDEYTRTVASLPTL